MTIDAIPEKTKSTAQPLQVTSREDLAAYAQADQNSLLLESPLTIGINPPTFGYIISDLPWDFAQTLLLIKRAYSFLGNLEQDLTKAALLVQRGFSYRPLTIREEDRVELLLKLSPYPMRGLLFAVIELQKDLSVVKQSAALTAIFKALEQHRKEQNFSLGNNPDA